MSDPYGESRHYSRDEKLARTHQHNPEMERLLELRDKDPDRYERMPRMSRFALGHYVEARNAAARVNGGEEA